MSKMKYEIKIVETDPFDIMCGDCPVHEIEWWYEVSVVELHQLHEEQMEMDEYMMDDDRWEPTEPDFDTWLRQSIENGYVRTAA